MEFTLQRGKRYRTTVSLGFVERIASNDIIANKFRDAGFTDVEVSGEGDTRYAEGIWNKDDLRPTYPPQVSDVSEVVA
ncbi:hypothetical protein [uncultured Hyphomicrobium sp.]|uniref:hypothetical protein n=1 Tax=uncultured Hyphomicrobium sp. TaxID=194373 RepID=UPI0025E9D083|nr:hypothetical protein [uncultured Hyphomicrobium sp.]